MPTSVKTSLKTHFRTIDGLQIRFAESDQRDEHVRAYPNELRVLGEPLAEIETPVQIICALWDWAVPPSNHRYLHRRLPNSKLDLIDAGHLPWEDAPDAYADLVTSWWAGGHGDNGTTQS